MEYLATVGLYSLASGNTIFVGGVLSRLDHFQDSVMKEKVLHAVIAFGGGVFVAAVAFVLTPQGMELLPTHYLLHGLVIWIMC